MNVLVRAQYQRRGDGEREIEPRLVRPPAERKGHQRQKNHQDHKRDDLSAARKDLEDVPERIDRSVRVHGLAMGGQRPADGPAADRADVLHDRTEPKTRHRDHRQPHHSGGETSERTPCAPGDEQNGDEQQKLRLGKGQGAEDPGPAQAPSRPSRVGSRQRHKDHEVGLTLQDGDEQGQEARDQRGSDDHRLPVHPQAAADQDGDERDAQKHVERRHRVIRGPVAQRRQRRDQQRVVGRMEVGQDDEALSSPMGYRQLELLLDQDVVDG